MHRVRFAARSGGALLLVALLCAAVAGVGSAHVTKSSGPFQVEIGWGSEPPLSGFANFVEVDVSGANGDPVAVPAGALSVEVSFGRRATTLPLLPDEGAGELRAALVPTRPGSYGFHVTGVVEGHRVDVGSPCSEATFECVGESAEVEFPVADPSSGELAERVVREADRVTKATDSADGAKRTARIALAIAAAALAMSVVIVLRARRRSWRS